MKQLLPAVCLAFAAECAAQNLVLHPLYNSIGVEVRNIGAYDSCRIEYKQPAATNWTTGFSPDRITLSDTAQFRGSIFLLEENTAYEIRATLVEADNGATLSLPTAQTTTAPAPEVVPTANVKWVSPSGSGNAYTETAPGNINALFASGLLDCGVTVVLLDGVYTPAGLQLTLQTDCSENNPVVLMAAPGAHPVFDGGVTVPGPWTPHASVPNLYSAAIPAAAAYSNICVLGDTAIYPYPSLTAELLLGNYNLAALSFGYSGFVRDGNAIWIKTISGIDPNTTTVTLSKTFRFLTVYGNNRNAWLKVRGITFRHFGKPVLNGLGNAQDTYGATVFDLRNVHHVYFDSCRFEFNTSNISCSNVCNHITIEHCLFRHHVGTWSHAMVKKSHDFVHTLLYTVASSRGRAVESPAIFLETARCVVVRNNQFEGVNSGVESYIDQGLLAEVDIYNNTFADNFDAVECDGLWTNLRVWNNDMIRPMAGISAAPPRVGPRYVYRNIFQGMKGRRNEADDPYFIECQPVTEYRSQGIGIKTNSGNDNIVNPGNLYFFNNTFYANDPLGFAFTSWDAEWREAFFANNIFYHTSKNPGYFASLANKPDYQLRSQNDNFFSANPAAPVLVAKHIHGQFDCTEIHDITEAEITLGDISGSSSMQFSNPLQVDPAFVSPESGNFNLEAGSPLIDAGVPIPGFYDYQGLRPDIGARETTPATTTPAAPETPQIAIYPNPACNSVRIRFDQPDGDCSFRLFNTFGQEIPLRQTADQLDLSGMADGTYYLQIESGGKMLNRLLIKMCD